MTIFQRTIIGFIMISKILPIIMYYNHISQILIKFLMLKTVLCNSMIQETCKTISTTVWLQTFVIKPLSQSD